MRIRFGPSGLPDLGGMSRSLVAINEMGFDACEFDFVRDFWLDKKTAYRARERIAELDISIRAHAPFYGVLSQADPKKTKMAVAMMHHTVNLVHLMGGDGITVHPGFYMERDRDDVMSAVEDRCGELEERLRKNGLDDVIVGVENMGNRNEFGGCIEDILDICELSRIIFPVIDWGHVNATCNGCLGGAEDFAGILNKLVDRLGMEGLEKARHQFSQVEFSNGVEKRHIGYEEGDMKLEHLLEAISGFGLDEIIVISESPAMRDHTTMSKIIRGWKG
jgi:deoxyribonuclease-4